YTLLIQIEWSGSYSRLYLLLGPVNELESCLLKAQSDHARVSMREAALFCCLFREERRRPRVLPKSTGKKKGLAIKLPRAQSPTRIITRSNPHVVYKPTRNDPLGQFLFTAARRLWTILASPKNPRNLLRQAVSPLLIIACE